MSGKTMAAVAAVVLVLPGAGMAQTHAPWPTDWNNWSDPALWVTVGNPGNAPAARYGEPGVVGAVAYTYNVGKFEVTAGQYCAFLNAVARTDTYSLYDMAMRNNNIHGCMILRSGLPGAYTYAVAADWAERPVNWVSWGDAARFCNWLTNGQPTGAEGLSTTEDGSYFLNGALIDAQLMAVTREPSARYVLPTEDEWYKAAYYDPDKPGGAGYWDFPTRCDGMYSYPYTHPSNVLIDPDPGNNANYGSPGTIGSPYYRTEVGEFENSESAYGTFDQGGNVDEWNERVIASILNMFGPGRGVRGGSFFDGHFDLARQNYDLAGAKPTHGGPGSGFRICEVPEPALASFLVTGAMPLLGRRKRGRGDSI